MATKESLYFVSLPMFRRLADAHGAHEHTYCTNWHTTPPIASLEAFEEWIQAGQGDVFTAKDAEYMAEEGWQVGLPATKTAFDEETDRRMAQRAPDPMIYITFWTETND